MPMNSSDALELLKVYLPDWKKNRTAIERADRWYRGKLNNSDKPSMPRKVTREYRDLRDRSMTRWLKFVVVSLTQALYVEGYRSSGTDQNAPGWDAWQANGLDARQIAIHRGALAHGLSYVTVMPGEPFPVIRGVSARKMVAFYQDVADDDWPMHAVRGEKITGADGKKVWRFRLYDDEAAYIFDAESEAADKLTFITHDIHGAGVCPVVRFANELDLDGRSEGEVEPNIDLAARIDQDTFDRMVVQRFGSWVVRTVAGVAPPDVVTKDDESAIEAWGKATAQQLSIADLLMAPDVDTKFGSLPATPLDGYIKAREADIRDLAAITQVPPQDLIGQMINISAEALAAAEAGKTRKLEERKHSFGESHEQHMRLSAHYMGDQVAAADFSAQVTWRDMESRSLAQAADALGKLAQMLGVPVQVLWSKIPGFTQQDVAEAKRLLDEGGGVEALMRELVDAQTAPAPPAE